MNEHDNMSVNEFIAYMHNNRYKSTEISTAIFNKYGERINSGAISSRIYYMKKKGIINYDNSSIKEDEVEFLDELESESGGLFKTGVIDIETTGLWSDFGYIIVAVIKDMSTGRNIIFRLDQTDHYKECMKNPTVENWKIVDKKICEAIRKAYEKFDIILHYNGRSFDIPFINTRLMKANVPILPDMKQLDLYYIARYKMRLRSKRLDALKEFLDIDTDVMGHCWEYWQMAGAGIKEGFDFVVEHCVRDVDRLTEVAKRMKVFINFIKK